MKSNSNAIEGRSSAPCSTWWRTRDHDYKINRVLVTRHTEKTVWLWNSFHKQEVKTARHSAYDDYWPTKERAEEHIRTMAETDIAKWEEQIAKVREGLAALSSNDPGMAAGADGPPMPGERGA